MDNIIDSIRNSIEAERQSALKYRLIAESLKANGYDCFTQTIRDIASNHEHNMRGLDYIYECLMSENK